MSHPPNWHGAVKDALKQAEFSDPQVRHAINRKGIADLLPSAAMEISGSIPMSAPIAARAVQPAALPIAAPSHPPEPSAGIKALVAGTVRGRVDFDAVPQAPTRPEHAFPLYTRAADALEAAVGVEVGRTIDVRA